MVKKISSYCTKILRYIRSNNITKSELAIKLNWSNDLVNLIIKGNYDFKLSEITTIENCLNIKIL